MITHVVLLNPETEISADEIARVLDHVRGLQEDIPGIVETRAGKNLSANNQGYTYGFVMRFVDAEHLKAYAPHPAHQVVSRELRAICESIIDFDIE
jgi:heme-degrading monooxygenase HmoA